jgi:phosphoglycolate phosphatase-like HAD superfamily hydrolase
VTESPTAIEIVRPPRGVRPELAIFDFDGTLSLIRAGWQSVMVPMMVEHLEALGTGRSREDLRALAADDVAQSSGRLTIHQMIGLARRVAELGGAPLDPHEYKAEYGRRLLRHIAGRREALASGRAAPDEMLVAGARAMLAALAKAGITLALFSGTDEPYVREEARLLDIDRYFGPHIYGALDDYEASEKRQVVARLLAASGVAGERLLVFGDDFVEIEAVKAAGGYTVGVASDESACGGRTVAAKRERLLRAGADMIIRDFAEHRAIARLLVPELGRD